MADDTDLIWQCKKLRVITYCVIWAKMAGWLCPIWKHSIRQRLLLNYSNTVIPHIPLTQQNFYLQPKTFQEALCPPKSCLNTLLSSTFKIWGTKKKIVALEPSLVSTFVAQLWFPAGADRSSFHSWCRNNLTRITDISKIIWTEARSGDHMVNCYKKIRVFCLSAFCLPSCCVRSRRWVDPL